MLPLPSVNIFLLNLGTCKRLRSLHRPVGQERREEGREEHDRHVVQQKLHGT